MPSLQAMHKPLSFQADPDAPHISLHALLGNATTETFCTDGTIESKDIIILRRAYYTQFLTR